MPLSHLARVSQTLEGVLRGRELELEQVREANRNLQWLKQEVEERQVCGLKERDAVISQLRASLQSRAKEAEVGEGRLHRCGCRPAPGGLWAFLR